MYSITTGHLKKFGSAVFMKKREKLFVNENFQIYVT